MEEITLTEEELKIVEDIKKTVAKIKKIHRVKMFTYSRRRPNEFDNAAWYRVLDYLIENETKNFWILSNLITEKMVQIDIGVK